jgi:hypothetical protein
VTQGYARAYLWFTLAASFAPDASMSKNSVRHRDDTAVQMKPAQIAEAQLDGATSGLSRSSVRAKKG